MILCVTEWAQIAGHGLKIRCIGINVRCAAILSNQHKNNLYVYNVFLFVLVFSNLFIQTTNRNSLTVVHF